MKMICKLLTALSILTVFAVASAAVAASTLEAAPVVASNVAVAPSLIQELHAASAQTRSQIAALADERADTLNPARRETIDLEIVRLKKESNLEFYRIQLRHFQAAGNSEAVAALELVLDKMINPPRLAQPQERPTKSRPQTK